MSRLYGKSAFALWWLVIAACLSAVCYFFFGGQETFFWGNAVCVAAASFHLARLIADAVKGNKTTGVYDWLATFLCLFLFWVLFISLQDGELQRSMTRASFAEFDDYLSPNVVMLCALLASSVWLYGDKVLDRLPARGERLYGMFLLLTPFLCLFISETACNTNVTAFRPFCVMLNLALWAILEIALVCLLPRCSAGLLLLYAFALFSGSVNHYLIRFRNSPLMAVDMLSLSAAKAVWLNYSYLLNARLAVAVISAFACAGFAVVLTRRVHPFKNASAALKRWLFAVGVLAAAGGAAWALGVDFARAYNVPVIWPNIMYSDNGMLVAFIASYHQIKDAPPPPAGYTRDEAREILNARDVRPETQTTPWNGEKPVILVVMNEAFGDLSVLGPLECTKEHLKFFNSMADDPCTLEFGLNFVSTYGGGTAKTEFEYLTGFSHAWLPGAIPYSQFDFSDVPTMAKYLKKMGYVTIAMHPENPYNWRRNAAYPAMGFDRFVSIGEFEGYERTIRNQVSDWGNYRKILDVLGEYAGPVFLFNVTMQNHGGYDIEEFEEKRRAGVDEKYRENGELRAYETLLLESDAALRRLVDVLREEKRPVVLCFFGDHQPMMSADFVDQLLKDGRKESDTELSLVQKTFTVPYFIWTNSPELAKRRKTPLQKSVISANYLGIETLVLSGLPRSDYENFLLGIKEMFPAINEYGYLNGRGAWSAIAEGRASESRLREYEFVQYYRMFDSAGSD